MADEMPDWLRDPRVYCVTVPEEAKDDVAKIRELMISRPDVNGEVFEGAIRWHLMPVEEAKFAQAVEHAARGLNVQGIVTTVLDAGDGKVEMIQEDGTPSVLFVRVMIIQGFESPTPAS